MIIATLLLAAAAQGGVDAGQLPRPAPVGQDGLLPINDLYYDLAARSGGDFYFWAAGEFGTANLSVPLHDEPVVLAYGHLDGGTRRFTLPVESGLRAMTLFVGIQRKDEVVLLRPDGSVVAAGDGGVQWQSFRHMAIASIASPSPSGDWVLVLAGAGKYSVSAHVKPANDRAAVGFDRFEFVEHRGRPGHEGWFPIERELQGGETVECLAALSGQNSANEFMFVTIDDQPIASVPVQGERELDEYFGHCLVPSVPFRVAVSGRDGHGQPFRRIQPGLVSPQ
jgi:von Willebrand factor A domain-containing protein 7